MRVRHSARAHPPKTEWGSHIVSVTTGTSLTFWEQHVDLQLLLGIKLSPALVLLPVHQVNN